MKIETPKYFTLNDLRLSGIYFFIKNGKVIYIGQTTSFIVRLLSHERRGEYDYLRFIPCAINDLDRYEKRWIIKFRPKLNFIHLFKMSGGWSNPKRRKVPINAQTL